MSEAVEKYAREYAEECVIVEKITSVKNLMKNMNWTIDQAMNALEISEDKREKYRQSIAPNN